jgi:hypothetical protein
VGQPTPGQEDERAWHLIELDTEFTFWGLVGLTLTEGSAAEQASYQDEPDERIAFTQLAAELAELGQDLQVPPGTASEVDQCPGSGLCDSIRVRHVPALVLPGLDHVVQGRVPVQKIR